MSNAEQQNETEVTTIPKKQKSSKAAIIIICCVVLAAAAAIGVLFGLPYLNYENAVKAMETADYEKAMALLEDISSNSFLSDEKKTDALYLKAEALLATKKYAEAKAIYTELGEYKDSADKLAECAYQNAIQLEDQGKYMEAYDEYMELGQYKDVAERRNTCCLNAMKSAIDTNDAQKNDLIEFCIKNPTIRDDAHEYIAISLETDLANGKSEEVYTMITEMLSSYAEHYLEPIYQLAIGYIEAKDHTKGAELLDLIAGHEYKDSAELVLECKYLSATELMKSAPEQAVESLYDLGLAEYKDSRELLDSICTPEYL